MKLINATVLSLFLLASTSPCLSQVASAQNSQMINITRRGSQQSSKGSAQSFTCSVRIEPVFDAHDPSRSINSAPIDALTVASKRNGFVDLMLALTGPRS